MASGTAGHLLGRKHDEVVSVGHVDAEHRIEVLVLGPGGVELGQGGGVIGRGAVSVEDWAKVGAVGVVDRFPKPLGVVEDGHK